MKTALQIFLSLLLFSNHFIYAGTTGRLAGRITDAVSGEPLPFVNVVIMGSTLGAATDVDGYYSIINVPPGNYDVKAFQLQLIILTPILGEMHQIQMMPEMQCLVELYLKLT